MADLGPAAGALFEVLAPVVGPALRSFLQTTVGMLLLGLGLASGSFVWAAQGSTLRGVLAALLALILCLAIGGVLAGKRAVARGLLYGVQKLQLGSRILAQIFDRLLGVSASESMGQRGGSVARTLEKLPLAQAEARLSDTVDALIAAPAQGAGLRGWLRRRLRARLVESVRQLTLARFRQAGSSGTGVDLIQVRDELAGQVDRLVGAKIEGALFVTSLALVLAAIGLSMLGALAIGRLPL